VKLVQAAPAAGLGSKSTGEKVVEAPDRKPDGAKAVASGAKTEAAPAESTQTEGAAKSEGQTGETPAAPAVAASKDRPMWLVARLDHARAEYRAGEWVALRLFASQPAHLRVYRVDPSGQVTRIFSTYGREETGQPARSFSMMLKAGEARPGSERVVAVGSARPLSREELLSCLHDYMSEGPVERPAPAASVAPPIGDTIPLADALKAVSDNISHAGDMPDAAAPPLDRAAWSIAVGRFVSMPSKVSARTEPQAAPGAADRS
jgi:hypothetical protein